MFRKMRRERQSLSESECLEIIRRGSSGVLAVLGDEGYPYAVPLSYVYHNGCFYFHCAKTGHKLDAIKAEPRVSFCIVDLDENAPERFTTLFRSVIVFGKAAEVEDEAELLCAVNALAAKYSPDESEEKREAEISGALGRLCMVRLTPEHMTGKQAIELVKS